MKNKDCNGTELYVFEKKNNGAQLKYSRMRVPRKQARRCPVRMFICNYIHYNFNERVSGGVNNYHALTVYKQSIIEYLTHGMKYIGFAGITNLTYVRG